jgi:hypothetical protein
LNSAGFRRSVGQAVTILEARTFSPPALPPAFSSSLGYFEEFAIPTRDLPAAAAFWERLGFIAFDPVAEPFGKIVAMGRDLNLGLYDLDLPGPALVFSDPEMAQTVARLLERGHAFARHLPRALIAADGALLQAPEGTLLLLRATGADTGPLDTGGFVLQETRRRLRCFCCRNHEADLQRVGHLDRTPCYAEGLQPQLGLAQDQRAARGDDVRRRLRPAAAPKFAFSRPFSVTAITATQSAQVPVALSARSVSAGY